MLENGEIDCIMGCFSMKGRLDDYQWAGPYMISRQVVAVNPNSDIYKLSDLEGKTCCPVNNKTGRDISAPDG